MPGHRAPGRRDQREVGPLAPDVTKVDVDEVDGVGELRVGTVIADERVGPGHPDAGEPVAEEGRRRLHAAVVLGPPVAGRPPAEGEDERIEEIGGSRMASVVERGAEDAVAEPGFRGLSGPDQPEEPGAGLGKEGVLRDGEPGLAARLLPRRLDRHPVLDPVAAGGRREEGRISERRPHEP